MSTTVPVPKQKSPRRSNAEIAADYAERSEKARRRAIEATPEFQDLQAASDGLKALSTLGFSPIEAAQITAVQGLIQSRIHALLNPKQGVSGTAP